MARRFLVVLLVCLGLPISGQTQVDPETLADIRQQLNTLYGDIQGLKRELSTTGSGSSLTSGGSTQERLDTLEFALQRLTAQTERLENRVNRIVADGTARIDDLEWRLVELGAGV